jgi:biopolymer transport protein TolR
MIFARYNVSEGVKYFYMLKRQQKKQLSEINVVPYIDVMLVLLIIFMVTAPLLSQGVKVDLPNAQAQPIATKLPEPIIVSIDAKGNYYLNVAANPGQPLTQQELATQVKQQLQPTTAQSPSNEQRQVLVKGDKNVDYGKVVQAMVILQQAGAASVGLMTQTDEVEVNEEIAAKRNS